MALVRENINFERGNDPKKSMKIGLRQSMERMGITFDTKWDMLPRTEEKIEENIKEIYEVVNLFLKAGLKPEDIRVVSAGRFYVKVYRLIEGVSVTHEVVSREDGEKLISVIKALSIGRDQRWRIPDEKEEKLVYTEEVRPWLENLEENRKKYSKI